MAITSPTGGTTSLPEYLQKRKPTALTPWQNVQPQQPAQTQPTLTPPPSPTPKPSINVATAPSPGVVGSQPIPPAPPPVLKATSAVPFSAPQPVIKPAVGGSTGSVPLSGLQGVIERQLGSNPQAPQVPGLMQAIQSALSGGNRYDNPLIQSLMTQQRGELEDVRRSEEDRAKVDASRRGVFNGTPLTNSLGDISERFVKGLAGARNDLLTRIADAGAQDRSQGIGQGLQAQSGGLAQFIAEQQAKNAGIGNAFEFGRGEMDNQRLQSDVLTSLGQLGMQGGPTLNGAFGSFDSLPGPQGADMSEVYKMLGSIFGGKV